jgi:large subunit ribosomal protein L32
MPVPKRKRSRARRDSRFANKGIQVKIFSTCKNCQDPILPHQACLSCGFYKGVKVFTTKTERSLKRVQLRQTQLAQQQAAAKTEQE